MKKVKVLLLLLLGSIPAFAQTPTYECRLMNDVQVSDSIYEFDIYLKQTGSTPLEVANTQVGLNFNAAIINGGTLTFSLDAGTSEFVSAEIPTSVSVDAPNSILRIAPKAPPGSGNGTIISSTGNGTRFGRFRLRNTVPFGSVTPNISWNFDGSTGRYYSTLSAYIGGYAVPVTDSTMYFVNLVNPVLNASISGQKFNDLNGNGTLDAGEPGLANWTIRLSLGGTQVDSQLTDAKGHYGFPGLANGTYTVTEQMQAGWSQTSTPSSYTVVVTAGSFSTNDNFGNFQLGSIRGQLFNDTNGNSAKDGGETGLSAWRMRLSKSGVQVDSTLSDGSGNYTFSNVTAGTYVVTEVLQAGWAQTLPPSGGDTVSVTSGTNATGKDFGVFQLGSISGMKFVDLNGNGIKDAGEPGLQNWQIKLSGPKTDSTTTDGNGNYTFTNLAVGAYVVSETQQNGWVQSLPSGNGTYSVSILSGTVSSGKNFGNYQNSSISGTSFNDQNGNSAKDGGEPGLSGWRIRLHNNGNEIDSALTDGSGNYSFFGLAPGTYTVSEASQNGWSLTLPSSPGQYTFTVTSGSTLTSRDFGNFQSGSISGLVFNDLDGNGSRDPGETTLSGWKIRLSRGGVQIDSILTDVNGAYAFQSLSAGTYTIAQFVQSGWMQTAPSSPGTYTVALTSGGNFTGKNFGNFQNGLISGTKFNDINGNGVKDAGESGLSGWRIRLSKNSVQVDSTLTDVSGNYTFQNLAVGTYTVSEVVQGGWMETAPSSPGTYTLSIISGSNFTGKDFGNFQLGTISGMKFNDLNGNGVKDPGESGLSGWRIRLSANGNQIDSTQTDGSGNYSFVGLAVGTYTVTEAQQGGWTQLLPVSPGSYTINVVSGTAATNKDFGNFQRGQISGMKFLDINANAAKDTNESGLAGWRIRLSLNGTQIDSLTTDANGNYTFSNLLAGTYLITEASQNTWYQSLPGAPGSYSVLISSGSTVTGKNFGNYQNGSVAGALFNDVNGNGTKDNGEPPLAGWKVRLVGVHTDSTLTDTNGNYAFAVVMPGTYEVRQDVNSGWIQTFPASQGTHTVTVVSGGAVSGQNFGNFQTVGIAGVKFNDLNGNGVRDPGEPRLSSWRIRLSLGGSQVDSALTDTGGAYLFKGLTAGTYTVSEVQQSGWSQSLPGSSGVYTVVITSGSSASAKDFGNYQRGSIAGQAFVDQMGDGTRNGGDVGKSGVLIRLSGATSDSALTDVNGNYSFPNIVPGNYTLQEVIPSGWILTLPASPGTYQFALTSGSQSTGKDFGNFQLGQISGLVYEDKNANASKDTDDTVVPGWKMELVRVGMLADTAVSDGAGHFTFASLGPGTYFLHGLVQLHWMQTSPPAPGYDTILMTSGSQFANNNFGNFHLGMIAGTVFSDANGNSRHDSVETGLQGWKVRIAGSRVDSTITDTAGHYAFGDLQLGSYDLTIDLQDGWYQSLPHPGMGYDLSISSGSNFASSDFGVSTYRPLNASVQGGWNILSMALVPQNGDLSKHTLFPTARSSAFEYKDGGYAIADSLMPGRGYWLRFDSAEVILLSGAEVRQESIAVVPGWNLIGSVSQSFPVSSITSDPPNIIRSSFFGYQNGYQRVVSLEPFTGYWVKSDSGGILYLSSGSNTSIVGRAVQTMGIETSGLTSLTIADGASNAQTLFIGSKATMDYDRSEMPPRPPEGSFDARFSTGRSMELQPERFTDAKTYIIMTQIQKLPLRISWHIAQTDVIYELSDNQKGAILPATKLQGTGTVTLHSMGTGKFVLSVRSATPLPRVYALEQNFPNPFNPSTEIRYALPATSRVSLSVYDILGQKVTQLVDGVQDAGYYAAKWVPNVGSGTYFYRLEAKAVSEPGKSFSKTRKMLLLR